MTTICSSGTSAAKAEFGTAVALTVPAIAALLNNVPTPWAVPLAAYIGLINYNLTTFCTTDPPTMPTITAGDVVDLLQILNPVAHAAAVAKFTDWIGAQSWFYFCECTGSATPAAPGPVAPPAGLPIVNPPTSNVGTICARYSVGPRLMNTLAGTWLIPDAGPTTGTPLRAVPLPANASTLVVHATKTVVGGGTPTSDLVEIIQSDASGADIGLTQAHRTVSGTTTLTAAVVANAVQWSVFIGGDAARSDTFSAEAEVYCGTTPGTTTSACCPTDPIVLSLLDRILQLTTLVQRQAAPFAYVYGANHTALSGHGSFAVSDLLGVSVDVTTTPGWVGSADGSPVELFDIGFVTLGTADGYETSRRIDHDGALVLPPSPGVYTTVGYTLNPGVVVSIRELVREP